MRKLYCVGWGRSYANWFRDIMLEFIPIENNQAYLFVKDLYLMQKGIYEYED